MNKRIRNTVVGKTLDGKSVVSGKEIFKLIDTFGFPLDLIYEILNENNIVFDFYEFVDVAISSGNFSIYKIRRTLSVLPYYDEIKFRCCVRLILNNMGSF